MNKTVIIIGGGFTGLIAAKELADKHTVILLEGNTRLGGRAYTTHPEGFLQPVEAGAEFVHGNLPETLALLKEACIEYVPADGVFYRREQGQWKEIRDMIQGWDRLLETMKKLSHDMPLYDFLQQHFSGSEYDGLRRQAVAYAEGFDTANVHRVSTKSLYKEWSEEQETNYRIPQGYGALVNFLEDECLVNGCTIYKGNAVKQIDWEPKNVTVYTASGKKYSGQQVIVTIPAALFQKSAAPASVNFTPALRDYEEAVSKIGVGGVIKTVFTFSERLWPADTGFILSDELIPTWWTLLPDTSPVLTGWAGGSKAWRLSNDTEEELLEKAFLSLSAILQVSVTVLKEKAIAKTVFNWQRNGWSEGGYVYQTPESAEAIQLISTPVDDTIFFAGEALYQGKSPGTVEAAIVQGKEVAGKIESEKYKV